MLVLSRPLLPQGFSNYALSVLWNLDTYVVDGKILADNLQDIFTALNGGIHANNLDAPSAAIPDKYIRFPEFYSGSLQRAPGSVHGHDGVVSSQLGDGAISMFSTEWESFGAWMCPARFATMLVCHGSIEINTDPIYTGLTQQFLVEVPYDREDAYGRNDTNTGYTYYPSYFSRVFTQIRNPDQLLQNKVSWVAADLVASSAAYEYWPYILLTVYWDDTVEFPWTIQGLYVDWVASFLVKRNFAGV